MKPTHILRTFLLAAGSSLLAVSSASAADGTWSVSAGAATHNWTDTGMWASGTIADGAGFTANFTGINITGAKVVSLNGTDRTIGNITFTDLTTSSHNLSITGNILTLDRTDSTAPQINVTQGDRTLTIGSQISGSDGLAKIGAGTLILSNASNNYTGGTTISAGTIQITADAHLGNSSGGLTFNGGTLVIPAGNTNTSSRNITVNDGIVGTMGAATNGNGGSFTHNGNLLGSTTSTFVYRANNDHRLTLNGTGGFSGALRIEGLAGRDGIVMNNASAIADTNTAIRGGAVGVTGSNIGANGLFQLGSGIGGAVTFNNRFVQIANNMTLSSDSATSGRTLTFTKAFDVIATTNSTLSLNGNGANGVNVLSGGGISNGVGGAVISLSVNSNLNAPIARTSHWAIGGTNTYSGNTTILSSGTVGTLRLDSSLAMQNSALDTTSSVAGGTNTGLRFNTGVTAVTLGGLIGNKNFAATGGVISTASSNYGNITALTLNPFTGASHSYAGVIANGASGMTLTKTGAGNQTLTNTNTYTGLTTVSAGTLALGHATDTISGAVNVNGGTLSIGGNSDTVGAVTLTSGSITGTTGVLTGSSYAVQSGSVSAILGGTSVGLTKSTGGTVTLSGVNTYTGTTTISAGTLALSGAGSIANSTLINNNSTLDVTAVTGNYIIGATQTYGGTGTLLATGKTVVENGTLSPGNSPGTVTVDANLGAATLQLGADGNLNWQIYDAIGAAGTGYDTVNLINGATLDLSALSVGSEYNINLWSLSSIVPSDANGDATNFNNALDQAWTLFSTNTAIAGFSTDKFQINISAFNGTSGFSNSLAVGGAFSVSLANGGTDIVLNYTVVPEPNVAALLGGLGTLMLLRRRRS